MIIAENKTNLLAGKQHFEILDGLRGIAAIVVVIYHFMEIAITDYNKNFLSHGFLAVDFFFCLSGFVIAYAYDSRAPHLGWLQFVKVRLIRLHPLVVIGSVLGLLTFLFDPFSDFYPVYGFGKTLFLFLASVFLIPYPLMPERYTNLFCLNAPAWSLFWEYIANIFYILILYKLNKKVLIVLALAGAACLVYIGVKVPNGNLGGGWGGQNFWDGGARVLYSFTAGMLVYRFNWIIKNKLGFPGMIVLLLAAFLFPYADAYNWITEPIIVVLYFPLLVALGAGTAVNPASKNICKLSGEISYPLYMTHYPFVWVFLTYVAVVKPGVDTLWSVIPVSVIFLIVLAYLVMKFIDIPLRKYLKAKFLT
ncbi:acyltransferase family protein [Pedobacter sp. KLB.chiD]|uniref:acyltransferase family protein n=1 Tax=Pedobacter sp. KLB.chiD TaxID=3387402 RepID=UPI00399A2E39